MALAGRSKLFAFWGACCALLSVGLGAFAAHVLKDSLSEKDLAIFQTGVHYQMFHSIGLFVCAWSENIERSKTNSFAGFCFMLGILFFSGSLYGLSLLGVRWLGAITPIGGVLFLLGWGSLGTQYLRRR